MVKYFLLLAFLISCNSKKKLLFNEPVHSDVISGRVYLLSYYNYTYDYAGVTMNTYGKVKPKIVDSALIYSGFIFFKSGIFRIVESYKKIDSLYTVDLLAKRKYKKDSWGVFTLRNDTLLLKGWSPSQGYPVYESIGKVTGESKITIYKTRCYSCNKLEYGYNWNIALKEYFYYRLNIKPDSITAFIRPKM